MLDFMEQCFVLTEDGNKINHIPIRFLWATKISWKGLAMLSNKKSQFFDIWFQQVFEEPPKVLKSKNRSPIDFGHGYGFVKSPLWESRLGEVTRLLFNFCYWTLSDLTLQSVNRNWPQKCNRKADMELTLVALACHMGETISVKKWPKSVRWR